VTSRPAAPAETSRRIPPRACAALLLVFFAVYVGALWTPGLLDDADSTHAEAAREMAVTHDYVTLKVNGVRYLEKPPLPYWIAAASFRIFGENEFALRLPIAMYILLLSMLAANWAARAYSPRAGVFAGLMMLTAAGSFLFTRMFIPEALLALLLCASLYYFLSALEYRQPWRWYAMYACIALAVLAKGLIAPVFVFGAIFVYCLLTGEWRRWREFRIFGGVLLFLAIAAPWHIVAGLRNPNGPEGHGFFWFYFINEHVLRFLGKRLPKDYNKQPALVYWLGHFVWLFPWSLFLPATVKRLIQTWPMRKERAHTLDFAGRTTIMCSVFAAMVLLFFSLSTNQEYYTFPIYVPAFILMAALLDAESREAGAKVIQLSRDTFGRFSVQKDITAGFDKPSAKLPPAPSRWVTGGYAVFSVLGLAIAIALIIGLWTSRHLAFVPDISTVLAKRGVGEYTLSTSHMFDLTGPSFAALRMPALIAAITMLVGAPLAGWMRLSKRNQAAVWTLGISMTVFLFAAHLALARFGTLLSSKDIAEKLQQEVRPQDKVMIYGDQAYGSSLLFYLRRPIYLVNGRSTSMLFGSGFPDAPAIFLNDDDLRREWASPAHIYVFVPAERLEEAEKVLGAQKRLVIESGEKRVFGNH
jgi:4-amino-4-deoxy-L-arabinose transferase-like glycosyltransferase